mmetsp:Transcript_9300/g.18631  ORF Transcript_9300/g.18631 Transcript_9300/m.18631 type:complete len:342 (-) Transcript_9300:42-1067(-)
MGSSALLVCFCVLVVLMLLHLPHVKRLAVRSSPLMPAISLILSSFSCSQSSRRESWRSAWARSWASLSAAVARSAEPMDTSLGGSTEPMRTSMARSEFFLRLKARVRALAMYSLLTLLLNFSLIASSTPFAAAKQRSPTAFDVIEDRVPPDERCEAQPERREERRNIRTLPRVGGSRPEAYFCASAVLLTSSSSAFVGFCVPGASLGFVLSDLSAEPEPALPTPPSATTPTPRPPPGPPPAAPLLPHAASVFADFFHFLTIDLAMSAVSSPYFFLASSPLSCPTVLPICVEERVEIVTAEGGSERSFLRTFRGGWYELLGSWERTSSLFREERREDMESIR